VTYEKGAPVVTPRSTERTRTLPSVRGAAVEAAKGRAFWQDLTRNESVEGVWPDGRVGAEMAESNARIGTPEAWDAGLTDDADPAALAQAAGAQALFVTDSAPGRLMSWWGTDDNADRPLTIATLNTADAARLRGAGRVDLTGTRNAPFTHDLSEGRPGAIPDRDLSYRPGKRDLATVHTGQGGSSPGLNDDGKTWQPVGMSGGGRSAAWQGTLSVPRDAASVSLRASAKDDRGGSVTRELLRAVRVR
jgi:hypothetical protein